MRQGAEMVILLIGLLLMSSVAFAQPGQHKSQRPSLPDNSQISKMLSDLSQTLNLSRKQQADVARLYGAFYSGQKADEKRKTGKNRPA